MKKYTILKNWHYAFFLFGRLFGWHFNKKRFVINFKFSKECWWNPPRNQDDYDLNKLIGLSFGTLHKNSIRLSWVPNFQKEDYITLYGYTYDSSEKEHESKYLCDIKVGMEYICFLELHEDKYVLDMIPFGRIEMVNESKDSKLQKTLYPYFGGNNKAIRKMYIWAKIKGV